MVWFIFQPRAIGIADDIQHVDCSDAIPELVVGIPANRGAEVVRKRSLLGACMAPFRCARRRASPGRGDHIHPCPCAFSAENSPVILPSCPYYSLSVWLSYRPLISLLGITHCPLELVESTTESPPRRCSASVGRELGISRSMDTVLRSRPTSSDGSRPMCPALANAGRCMRACARVGLSERYWLWWVAAARKASSKRTSLAMKQAFPMAILDAQHRVALLTQVECLVQHVEGRREKVAYHVWSPHQSVWNTARRAGSALATGACSRYSSLPSARKHPACAHAGASSSQPSRLVKLLPMALGDGNKSPSSGCAERFGARVHTAARAGSCAPAPHAVPQPAADTSLLAPRHRAPQRTCGMVLYRLVDFA